MTIARKIKNAFRGQVSPSAALFEIGRRTSVGLRSRYERATQSFDKAGTHELHLLAEYSQLSAAKLLEHFRSRSRAHFFAGFEISPDRLSAFQRENFPTETLLLLDHALNIVRYHRWSLLGYGELDFGQQVDWLRDPVSGIRWPSDCHGYVALRNPPADARVLWELNRMGHLLTLGRAHAVTGDESFAEEVFVQVEGWRDQNRPGFGPNWSCAMEVALRAINLLATFNLLRDSKALTEPRLAMLLTIFDQHGRFIRSHLEFSFIATSNHYLSDVAGLLWLGVSLPELEQANEWRLFGLRELLSEMDKQVLPGGAHYELSTGYHRFVVELFLYSFILCRANSIEIGNDHWLKLRSMVEYVRAYLRPDGQAPLIGDSDSGQFMPIVSRAAADHAYILGVAAGLFDDGNFKSNDQPPQELFWLLGESGPERYGRLTTAKAAGAMSSGFPDAGTFVLRDRDCYLLFNASGTGLLGRGAHGHNDALSVEVSVCSTSFISDPGTYVYTGDLTLRHQFRSTAYHSTVEIDGREQNTTEESSPFRLGNESSPQVLHWESGDQSDLVIAEHYGYKNLPNGSITHRRAVRFEKAKRYWLIEDELLGEGTHNFRFCFHITPGLEILSRSDGLTELCDKETAARLLIAPLDGASRGGQSYFPDGPIVEPRWFSRDYGEKRQSVALCWTIESEAPIKTRWLLVPICGADGIDRERLIEDLRSQI